MQTDIETVLDVEGMSCGSCVRHVTHALKEVSGVLAVDVNLQTGTASVRHDPTRASLGRLLAALEEAGYSGKPRLG